MGEEDKTQIVFNELIDMGAQADQCAHIWIDLNNYNAIYVGTSKQKVLPTITHCTSLVTSTTTTYNISELLLKW